MSERQQDDGKKASRWIKQQKIQKQQQKARMSTFFGTFRIVLFTCFAFACLFGPFKYLDGLTP